MFRMLIATPLYYLGVVFKDFYFRSGVLLSISNNYNKYVTRKLIRKKTWLVAHIHRTDSYVRILFMCFCLFRRAASMLSLFCLFVCLFFSYPICVDIDEVLWPFRLCLCFRSWNVRIVSPDMRWQWKGKKKKKNFTDTLSNLLNVSHCYSGFPLNVESNFECFFVCMSTSCDFTDE